MSRLAVGGWEGEKSRTSPRLLAQAARKRGSLSGMEAGESRQGAGRLSQAVTSVEVDVLHQPGRPGDAVLATFTAPNTGGSAGVCLSRSLDPGPWGHLSIQASTATTTEKERHDATPALKFSSSRSGDIAAVHLSPAARRQSWWKCAPQLCWKRRWRGGDTAPALGPTEGPTDQRPCLQSSTSPSPFMPVHSLTQQTRGPPLRQAPSGARATETRRDRSCP